MTEKVQLGIIGAAVVFIAIAAYGGWQLYRSHSERRNCGPPEGIHYTVDTRDFETKYAGYVVTLEAEVVGKGKLAGKIEQTKADALSEAIQKTKEFQKALVHGFNSCAVTKASYDTAVIRFRQLDQISGQINALAVKPAPSTADNELLKNLVDDYIRVSRSALAPRAFRQHPGHRPSEKI